MEGARPTQARQWLPASTDASRGKLARMPRGLAGLASAVWIVAIVAVVFLLRAASQLLIPIVLAVLFSYALEPVVAWLARRHVPRLAGAGAVLAIILGLSGWGAYSLRDDALQALEALPDAARRARALVWSGGQSGPGRQVQRAAEAIQGSPQTDSVETPGAGEDRQPRSTGAMSDWVQRVVGSVLALAGHITVIVFLVFFLLISGSHFRTRILEIAGPHLERRRITASIIDDINAQIQRFLLVHLFTAAVVAAATWGVLAWMGVSQAAVWGILAGVFNSIPYFGPIIVSGGLLVVGLMQSGNPMQAIKMAGAALVITSLEGWLLTPPLLGKAERMHVVVVFLGVLLWTWIWGGWGTILAVPMLVVVKSVADHVESLKPVRRLMAP
jgi:predicted PurR-regulated permease PerM